LTQAQAAKSGMVEHLIVVFFLQMKPEKTEVVDGDETKPWKLANDLNGYNKKKKPDLPGLSPEAVSTWIQD